MLKNILNKLPNNLNKFIFFCIPFSVVFSLLVLFLSFSISAFLVAFAVSWVVGIIFFLLDYLKILFIKKKIRIIPIVVALVLITISTVAIVVRYDEARGLSAVFSKEKRITSADELLKCDGNYKNVVLSIDSDSFFKTEYRIEIITSDKNEQNETSGIWDEDQWIDNVISNRELIYQYYVFPIEGKYFVAKVSADTIYRIENSSGAILINGLASSPNGSERKVCEDICKDITKILYSVDRFEGEESTDYFDDLDIIKGESTVLITVENRNLFFERTWIISRYHFKVIQRGKFVGDY